MVVLLLRLLGLKPHLPKFNPTSQTYLAEEGRPQIAVNFASGSIAAVAATVLTQPMDVVRTRMQLGLGAGGANSGLGVAMLMQARSSHILLLVSLGGNMGIW